MNDPTASATSNPVLSEIWWQAALERAVSTRLTQEHGRGLRLHFVIRGAPYDRSEFTISLGHDGSTATYTAHAPEGGAGRFHETDGGPFYRWIILRTEWLVALAIFNGEIPLSQADASGAIRLEGDQATTQELLTLTGSAAWNDWLTANEEMQHVE